MITADYNKLTALPELSSSLTHLSCAWNRLTSLPLLPHGLRSLYCYSNPLEALPELPSTLLDISCELPHNNQICRHTGLTPEVIQQLNHENQEWMESQSRIRCITRCSTYYEELMDNRWHPDRIDYLCSKGYVLGNL